MGVILPYPCWFFLNNLETIKPVTLEFWPFSSISLETFVPNLVFLTCPSSYIFWFPDLPPISRQENCHNFRTCDDIDMERGPLTTLDKRNKKGKKYWPWGHVNKLWRHWIFFYLCPIWSNLEDGFRIHSLYDLHFL